MIPVLQKCQYTKQAYRTGYLIYGSLQMTVNDENNSLTFLLWFFFTIVWNYVGNFLCTHSGYVCMYVLSANKCKTVFSFLFSFQPTPGQPSPCKPTQHWVEEEDGSHRCINCGTCPPGQGLSKECGSSELLPFKTMVVCVPCNAGVSFSRYEDSSKCIPCASCSKDQIVEQRCSPEGDIKCTNKCSSKDRYNY